LLGGTALGLMVTAVMLVAALTVFGPDSVN